MNEKQKQISKLIKEAEKELNITHNYFNLFKILNLRENSHTELLKWLFENNNKFLNGFLKLITENPVENIQNLDIVSQKKSENAIPDLVILLNGFKCVIEVKLDAKPSITKNNEGQNRTQMERCCENLAKDSQYKDKYYTFLSPEKRLLSRMNISVSGKDNEDIKNLIKCENANKISVEQILNALNSKYEDKLKVKNIDFGDIIKVLFDSIELKDSYSKDVIKLIISEMIGQNDGKNAQNIKEFLNNLSNDEINIDNIKTFNELKNLKDYRVPNHFNLPLYDILNDKNLKQYQNVILWEYLEYWQFYTKFNDGYTQIVKRDKGYEFLWDICAELIEKNNEKTESEILNEVKKYLKLNVI